MAHFFPSYTFDLDKTLYFFTSGRFEYRNKGFDLTVDGAQPAERAAQSRRLAGDGGLFLCHQARVRQHQSGGA